MIARVEHNLGITEAKKRINNLLEELQKKQFPGGVKIKDAQKQWLTGDSKVMEFSFKAKKGFLGTTISGKIVIQDDMVVLQSDIPGMVTSFVSEDKIREVIEEEAHKLLL